MAAIDKSARFQWDLDDIVDYRVEHERDIEPVKRWLKDLAGFLEKLAIEGASGTSLRKWEKGLRGASFEMDLIVYQKHRRGIHIARIIYGARGCERLIDRLG